MTDQEPEVADEFLKTDVLGRVRVRPQQREKLLDAFEASAMSGQSFAIHHGIKVQTFASWIQKRRRSRGDYEDEATRQRLRMPLSRGGRAKRSPEQCLNLIEVCVNTGSSDGHAPPLEVVLPGGAIVRVSSESQIDLLKSLLRELPCWVSPPKRRYGSASNPATCARASTDSGRSRRKR
jgi:hypothetical protein